VDLLDAGDPPEAELLLELGPGVAAVERVAEQLAGVGGPIALRT
jgi:hypothetical protein